MTVSSDTDIKIKGVPAFRRTNCRLLIAPHLPRVMCKMQATDRSITLETHLHSVKVEKCSFMQGMWDVAMIKLPKVLNCCDMDSCRQSLKKRSAASSNLRLFWGKLSPGFNLH